MPGDFSEDALIEQPAIALLGELGWHTANCYHETFGEHGALGRETSAEVVLVYRASASVPPSRRPRKKGKSGQRR